MRLFEPTGPVWEKQKTPILTVSQLTNLVKKQLEANFPDVWVEGEVSNLKIPSSGHLYFTLKDKTSQVKAVIFRSSARFLKFRPRDGQQLLCRAHVTVYEPKGEYQLVIDYMEPKGLGALQQAFEQLKERLAREGLFDVARKRPLPMLPKKIGIVTSPTGAVIRDMLQILARRYANIEILINPVQVQGGVAATEIARAIEELNLRDHPRDNPDVIILARGGGSLEDLWPFNEEIVARAIYRSKIPVISAVGHETDYTISDFVADLRAPTPSAAAELVIVHKAEIISRLESSTIRLRHAVLALLHKYSGRMRELLRGMLDPRRKMELQFQRLDELDRQLKQAMIQSFNRLLIKWEGYDYRLLFSSPSDWIDKQQRELDRTNRRLSQQIRTRIQLQQKMLEKWVGKLDALSPLEILARGYSIARRLPDMTLIKEAGGMQRGELFHLTLQRGELISRVEEVRLSGGEAGPSGR